MRTYLLRMLLLAACLIVHPGCGQGNLSIKDNHLVAMFRGDEGHTGVSPAVALKAKPSVAWKFLLNNKEASSPTACDGTIYVETGRHGDTSYPEGILYALDAKTGSKKWSVPTDNRGDSTPALGHGLIFFAGKSDTLYALDAGSGKSLWKFPLARSWRDPTMKHLTGSPTVSGDTVYFNVGYQAHMAGVWWVILYALDATTGKQKWESENGSTWSSPVVHQGLVFTGDNEIFALDANTGEVKWRYLLGKYSYDGSTYEDHITDSAAASNGVLYVATFGSAVHALDAATGRRLWTFQRGGGYTARSAPAVSNGSVFIGASDGFLHALDAKTGSERWKFRADAQVNSSATVAEDTVYFGDYSGTLYALDAENGKERWRYNTGGTALLHSASLDQGILVITVYHGGFPVRHELIAFR